MLISFFLGLVAIGLTSISVLLYKTAKNKLEPSPITASIFLLSLPFWVGFTCSFITNVVSTGEIAVTNVDTSLQYQAAGWELPDVRETKADRVVKYAQAGNLNSEGTKFEAEAGLYDAQANDIRLDTSIKADDHNAEYIGKTVVWLSKNWILIGIVFIVVFLVGRFGFRNNNRSIIENN